jgi:hypothetical protein
MADKYRGVIPIVDRRGGIPPGFRDAAEEYRTGAEPRDYDEFPDEMMTSPSEMTLIPRTEWDARFDEENETGSSLEHRFLGPNLNQPEFVNLDQGPIGYCWAASTAHAMMMKRLASNLPVARLSLHSVAAIIKNGRDEGGWCGLSAKYIRENGIAVEGNGPGQWPALSRNVRNATPEVREAMRRHTITEDWYDMGRREWEQSMTIDQIATQLMNINPVAADFDWWGHSVCLLRLVRIERGSWGWLMLNSWRGWGHHGLAVIRESEMKPMGAVAIRQTSFVA